MKSSLLHFFLFFSSPPKKYKIVPHNRPLRNIPGPGPSNVIGIVKLNNNNGPGRPEFGHHNPQQLHGQG